MLAALGFPILYLLLCLMLSPSLTNGSCPCGKSTFGLSACGSGREGRVVGGREALQNEIPWQVNLQECQEDGSCGGCSGSIIGRRYIISAAHCFYSSKAADVEARVGFVHESKAGALSRVYGVDSITIHKGWNPHTVDNDIALIRVDQEMEFNEGVSPICLPKNSSGLFEGLTAIVSGWGTTSEASDVTSEVLKRTKLKVISNGDKACIKGALGGSLLPTAFLCALAPKTDACRTDSGGPLAVGDSQSCVLAGITSYGKGCARPGIAGIYTRVSEFLPWIQQNIKNDDDCLSHLLQN